MPSLVIPAASAFDISRGTNRHTNDAKHPTHVTAVKRA